MTTPEGPHDLEPDEPAETELERLDERPPEVPEPTGDEDLDPEGRPLDAEG